MNVMLLAAGEGTRLRPYTTILPKPAIPFLTVPLAAHALSFLGNLEIRNLVVNTYHLPHKIHELFHTLPHKAQALHFSDEVGQILGSGGGLGNARHHFAGGGDFIMMNADEVILPQQAHILAKALEQHKKSGALATLMVMDHHGVGTQFGGVWTDSKNKVLGFGKSAITGSHKGWHFVGVQILSDKVFNYIPMNQESNILYDALTKGIEMGDLVEVFPFDCAWFETGNPKDFMQASEHCFHFMNSSEDSFQKIALTQTLKRFAPERISFKVQGDAHLVLSESAKISPSAHLQGLIVCGKNSAIKSHCKLKNVIAGSDVLIPENTEASDQIFI